MFTYGVRRALLRHMVAVPVVGALVRVTNDGQARITDDGEERVIVDEIGLVTIQGGVGRVTIVGGVPLRKR